MKKNKEREREREREKPANHFHVGAWRPIHNEAYVRPLNG